MLRTTPGEAPTRLAVLGLSIFALARNFGGKPEVTSRVIASFHHEVFGDKGTRDDDAFGDHLFSDNADNADNGGALAPPPALELIAANLADHAARHLMVLIGAWDIHTFVSILMKYSMTFSPNSIQFKL